MTLQVAVTPLPSIADAVMMAVPGAFAVTTPACETEAISGALLLHSRSFVEAKVGKTVACITDVLPSATIVISEGESVIDSTNARSDVISVTELGKEYSRAFGMVNITFFNCNSDFSAISLSAMTVKLTNAPELPENGMFVSDRHAIRVLPSLKLLADTVWSDARWLSLNELS